jgi:hypothetical protein
MPNQVVDLSARSRLIRGRGLRSHAWVATPAEVLAFLRDPRVELKKMNIRLPSTCRVETLLENHDWLSGHTDGFERAGQISILCRGEGDGHTFYRVSLFASKTTTKNASTELLHAPDEESRRLHPLSRRGRALLDASRRSLRASPTQLAAHRWIAPLLIQGPMTKPASEAHRIFAAITDLVARLIRENRVLREARDEVATLLQQPIKPGYSMVFRSDRARRPEWHEAFTGAMYAKSLWLLRTSGWHFDSIVEDVTRLLEQPESAIRTLRDSLRSVDPDLIPHTLVEITELREEDPMLDARLTEAEDLFARHNPKHSGPDPRFHAPGKGLERLGPSNADEWWFLPALIAFAITVWPQERR